MREDLIHVAIRRFLSAHGWTLIAGQYPNGSDELPALFITDPTVARDKSPDPRRHAADKIVPDLVSNKAFIMLLIEIKPGYSPSDQEKLLNLLNNRRTDLVLALTAFLTVRRIPLEAALDELIFVPCLGFAANSRYTKHPTFCYLKVHDINKVEFEGNVVLPEL